MIDAWISRGFLYHLHLQILTDSRDILLFQEILTEGAKMRPAHILILLALLLCLPHLASGSVMVNEVELDYLEDDVEVQWVELYNSGPGEVDVSGWAIISRDDLPRKELVPDGTVIPPGGFYQLSFSEKWINNFGAVLTLLSDTGQEMDRTISLFDIQGNSCAWGRYPDGGAEWLFMESTPGEANSGVPCEEEESKALRFNMIERVSGKGYVNVHDRAVGPDGSSLLSHEHGSGDYQGESSIKMNLNMITNTSSIQLRKDGLSMNHEQTVHELPGNMTAVYDSRWAESSATVAGSNEGEHSSRAAESTTYASSISKDLQTRSEYGSLKLNLSSDSVGRTNIEYYSESLKLSEDYLGAFAVDESISGDDYQRTVNSTSEPGYVDVYKKAKKGYSTYERGSGIYRAEELIKGGDKARKDLSLTYLPSSYEYSPRSVINRSHKWEEGFKLNISNSLYAEEHYSSLERMDIEVQVNWPNVLQTSSNFTGRANLKSAFRPDNNSTSLSFVEDDYVGSYNIERKITILPKYATPHMSVYKKGHVDPDRCDILWFTVTVVNDGNRTFAPIYVRDTFPTGTRFIGSSIEPIELTRSYGNWSIPSLGSGESASIDMQFQVITRKENYTNRARANTIYVYSTRGAFKERNLRVSNSTTLDVDWGECAPEILPLDFSATISQSDERIVNYRLILNNSAGYNMSANVTALLPQGMSFINSTTATLENQSGVIKWNIKKLDSGRRRTVSFMARAEREGLFEVDALVEGRSIEGNDSISARTSALIRVGKVPGATNIESLQSMQWLPCDDSSLYQSLAKLEATTSSKELKCCY